MYFLNKQNDDLTLLSVDEETDKIVPDNICRWHKDKDDDK